MAKVNANWSEAIYETEDGMTTLAAALRTYLVNQNIAVVGTKVYKDLAPPSTAYPYITYADSLADRSALTGNGKIMARNNMVQVDLWQKRPQESSDITDALIESLEDATLTGSDKTIFRCRLVDVRRIVEFDDDKVHHALTLNIYHKV